MVLDLGLDLRLALVGLSFSTFACFFASFYFLHHTRASGRQPRHHFIISCSALPRLWLPARKSHKTTEMDLLKAEIERKKRAAEAAKKSAASSGAAVVAAGSSSKYMKASERRRLQEEKEAEDERRRREEADNKKRGSSKNKKRRRDGDGDGGDTGGGADKASAATTGGTGGDASMSKSSTSGDKKKKANGTSSDDGSPSKDNTTASGSKRQKQDKLREELNELAPADVAARLRSLGLPIRLFGERTAQRIDRLYDALERQRREMAGLSEMDEFRLGSGHGIRNPFLDKRGGADDVGSGAAAATDKISSAGAKKSGGDDSTGGKKGKDNGDTKSGEDKDEDDDDDPHKKIHKFFKSLLKQWEDDLAHRPDSIKQTAAGRNETKTYKQCKDYIRPLFKMCKSRRLEPGMMTHILNIVNYCEQGEFVKANDAYIDVAIGRAAWPIGVTMVGIHARSGREKIGSSNIAHAMNNELQRKYLTSVKRLMSYCQKKRADVDPSKKVVNM